MAGYLDSYGVADQKRERNTKRIVFAALGLAVVGLAAFLFLHNRAERAMLNQFLAQLKAGDFQQAYRTWGCTPEAPCRDYKFEKFMEDWGPNGVYKGIAAAKVPVVDSCGGGVVMTLELPGTEPLGIWADRGTHTLGFAPWPRCPGRHLHLWEFLESKL